MRRIYDFDGTIFDGDSTARFCLFALIRHKRLALGLPRVGWHFLKMALGRESKTRAKQALYQALLGPIDDVDQLVEEFWQIHFSGVKGWYLAQKAADDLIISASPEFLLAPVCKRLGVSLIASPVDKATGLYRGANCDGQEKVNRYRAQYPPEDFEFYSDALIDAPMACLAQRAWLVKGDDIAPWPNADEEGAT